MKQNLLQSMIRFVLKYIWLICLVLMLLEMGSTLHSANVLMQQTAQGVMQSVAGEISGRVDGVLRLLTGLSNDERFADASKPLYDRAMLARPYRESHNLFMIALTDEQGYVVSTNALAPDEAPFSLAARDYMQRLYATGTYQITDAFPAGTDGVTMNYTVAVPILQDGVTKGSVFGSIYFEDIEGIIARNTYGDSRRFCLLGANNTYMAGRKDLYGKSLLDMSQNTRFFMATSAEEIDAAVRRGEPQCFWKLDDDGLCYATSMRIAPTNWTLVYQVRFTAVLSTLLPVLLLKIGFYVLLCLAVSLFGQRYLHRQLAAVSHLLDRVASMQKKLFQSEQSGYDALLKMTEMGLTDQLTGLSTRTILFSKMQQFDYGDGSSGAVFFLDLDDLKHINDTFGHESGDRALCHIAYVLKQYEQKYQGLAARYGGDEFILFLNGIEARQIAEIAEELCAALHTTIASNGANIPIHGSIGVSLYPQHGKTAEELISKADFALYTAKRNGKNRYAFYDHCAHGL